MECLELSVALLELLLQLLPVSQFMEKKGKFVSVSQKDLYIHLHTYSVTVGFCLHCCRKENESKILRDSLILHFLLRLINTFDFKGAVANRTASVQGGHQAAGLCVAIAFGLVGGALVGECK